VKLYHYWEFAHFVVFKRLRKEGKSMKKPLFLASLLALCLPLAASAQEATPKVEIFGGYSYLRYNTRAQFFADSPPVIKGNNAHGFNTSLAGNISKHVGIVGEFSRFTNSESVPVLIPNFPNITVNTNVLTYLFGPRVVLHRGKAGPFVHALFGGARENLKVPGRPFAPVTDNAFAFALGGGLDVKAHDNFAIRVAQVDYLGYKFTDQRRNIFRYSAGIVIRLGKR
jgi:opacity protein-like surface antigen